MTCDANVVLTAAETVVLPRKLPSYRNLIGRPQVGMRSRHARSRSFVDAIRQRVGQVGTSKDGDLAERFRELSVRVSHGESVTSSDIAIEAFALTFEAIQRTTGMSYFDVQLIGGLILAVGAVAEIQTGEGKTIISALPASLHALGGGGVHVATTNAYLSERDFRELRPAYELLGLSVGLLEPQGSPAAKREAYSCDITYGPGYEFGFDFLRDQLTLRSRRNDPLGARFLERLRGHSFAEQCLTQRGHVFALIDEADSVLIDEATTPLILSGMRDLAAADRASYRRAHEFACTLEEEKDFIIDPARRSIQFTKRGWNQIHRSFDAGVGRIARSWVRTVENALRANCFLQRDVDYVVSDGHVLIVDQNTGRIHPERSWRSGLHQAVEAKEQLEVTAERETQARITRQRFCHFYDGLSGLTGTAAGSEHELREIYQLPVVNVPTHRPCIRKTDRTRFFASLIHKYSALVDDMIRRQSSQQPILIGTRTIRDSKLLSAMLAERGLRHAVLNGQQDAEEAAIIARAGQHGAITIATNMAGRGTDIRLDKRATAAGGLHVIAAEFHESSRVDRQLAGRSARQGDPGSCQFFSSAEDDMIQRHDPGLARRIRDHADKDGECHVDLSAEVHRLQRRLEAAGLAARRQMVASDHRLEVIQEALAKRA